MENVLTEEEKKKRLHMKILIWKHSNKEKVKAYNAKHNKNPDRMERERKRVLKTYYFKKEFDRIKNLCDCV